jgi:hypothetical protein
VVQVQAAPNIGSVVHLAPSLIGISTSAVWEFSIVPREAGAFQGQIGDIQTGFLPNIGKAVVVVVVAVREENVDHDQRSSRRGFPDAAGQW